jgi:hypothetical protein
MIASQNFPRHTLDKGTIDPTGTNDPDRLPIERNAVERSGNRDCEAVPIVPLGSVVPFSEVRRALFPDAETVTETKPVSAAGGGEESATTDDDGPWVIDAEAAARLDELEEVDFDDVPVCSCGRYCDVQTLDDAWHCSECDPNAEERRKRTQRLFAAAERIRRENSLPESDVTYAIPQP